MTEESINLNPPIDAEFAQRYPQHAQSRLSWEPMTAIQSFLDAMTSEGKVLCKKHKHTDACYGPATGETVRIAGVWCGVTGRPLTCRLQEDGYYPLGQEAAGFVAAYFGIDLAKYDKETEALRAKR